MTQWQQYKKPDFIYWENPAQFSYPDFILPITRILMLSSVAKDIYSIMLAVLGIYTTLREE